MTHALTIASTSIRQDQAGRYCLNDLHKAAGGEKRHAPAYFINRAELRELEGELSPNTGIPAIAAERGRYGGTYVVKELVYAYAMWISPRFHLQVIRAYDGLVSQQAPQEPAVKAL